MNNPIFALDSPTRAIKARHLLVKSKIEARIVKLDEKGKGCTHGVQVKEEDMMSAVAVLRSGGIRYTLRYENDLS